MGVVVPDIPRLSCAGPPIDETGIQAPRGALRTVYATPLANGSSFFVTHLETSELAKVAASAFLATKIPSST